MSLTGADRRQVPSAWRLTSVQVAPASTLLSTWPSVAVAAHATVSELHATATTFAVGVMREYGGRGVRGQSWSIQAFARLTGAQAPPAKRNSWPLSAPARPTSPLGRNAMSKNWRPGNEPWTAKAPSGWRTKMLPAPGVNQSCCGERYSIAVIGSAVPVVAWRQVSAPAGPAIISMAAKAPSPPTAILRLRVTNASRVVSDRHIFPGVSTRPQAAACGPAGRAEAAVP